MRISTTQAFRDYRARHVGLRLMEFAGDLGVGTLDAFQGGTHPISAGVVNGAAALMHVASGINRIQQTRREAFMLKYEGADINAAQLCAVEAFGDGLSAAGFASVAVGGSPAIGYGLVAVGSLTSLAAGWKQGDI